MKSDREINGTRYRIIKDYGIWRIIKHDYGSSRYLRLPSGALRHWKSEENASKYLDSLEAAPTPSEEK
jgi:hypothetical protein